MFFAPPCAGPKHGHEAFDVSTTPIDLEHPSSPLEVIRRAEAEVKRRLAAEREAVEAVLAEAERQAGSLLTTAEIEGRRAGEAQRQAARAEADRKAEAILAQARTEAEGLQRVEEEQMAAAVERAVAIVIGGARET